MQDKKNYKEQSDDFSNLMRHRLENHRMLVDDDCWNEIESRIKPKNKVITWWLAGTVAAVAIMLLVLVLYPYEEKQPEMVAIQQLTDTTTLKQGQEEQEKLTPDIITKSVENTRLISQKARGTVSNKANNLVKESNVIDVTLSVIDTVHLAIVDKTPSDSVLNNIPERKKADSIPSNREKRDPWITKEPTRLFVAKKEKRQQKWLLAASVSSGGNISVGNGSYDNAYFSDLASTAPDRPSIDLSMPNFTAQGGTQQILSPSDFTNISHSMPLSFGITVRKDINKYIGVETGLVYTYLSSRFQKGGTPSFQAKQELHYVGVPLNMVIYLWNSPKWNIYISGGGMAEKGLRRSFSQDMHRNNDPVSKISVKEGIDGVQWSLNASVGVSYRFYQNWGLYFEPRYSYFYNNNQPISIRTENPRVFGLNAGFRYEF